ncbi:MAG: DnaA/Hda family protein, partial [Pseudomonadota bacterium]
MAQNFPFEHFFKSETKNVPVGDINNILPDSSASVAAPDDSGIMGNFTNHELDKINQEILNHLRTLVNPEKFNAYFTGHFHLEKIALEEAEFTVATNFIRDVVVDLFLGQIQDALFHTIGKRYNIKILVLTSSSSNQDNPLSSNGLMGDRPKNAKEAKFTLNLNATKEDLLYKAESKYIDHITSEHSVTMIDPNKTFDNFIIGPSNNMAWATAKACAQNPGKSGKYPCLYIHSASGLGKTHLLHAVANEIRERYPHMVICLITARDFMKEMINNLQNKSMSEFQKKYSEKTDVLMIDDIHELKEKEGTQNEFFHIFNVLHNKGKQLLFTSDK